ncbi:hypothetical protein Lokhon_02601 [Limimaricola hongkongensis DSM 17492]|uniref:Uncharacterized protein n=1 Tax=Limimaricola hongkongensis DSM 17492 TaxID=1122180 RepID=A0A017H8Z5_9RHOB|nr:hypothetical protein Lokhon_02601 [Limimaricola hongkongensis DSM 17492]
MAEAQTGAQFIEETGGQTHAHNIGPGAGQVQNPRRVRPINSRARTLSTSTRATPPPHRVGPFGICVFAEW